MSEKEVLNNLFKALADYWFMYQLDERDFFTTLDEIGWTRKDYETIGMWHHVEEYVERVYGKIDTDNVDSFKGSDC